MTTAAARGDAREVFRVFLRLGLTSFGGPIAHLGYFRDELVVRRKWLDDADYADLVALCQFLPGPASSQTGFALGLRRAGWAGAVAAWCGFTLPSAILLVAFAQSLAWLAGPVAQGALAGLKLVAVAVVAQAVLGMARTLCPDKQRAAIAAFAIVVLGLVGGALGQITAIVLGGLAGLALVTQGDERGAETAVRSPVGRSTAWTALVVFLAGLVVLPALVTAGIGGQIVALVDAFWRAGALVFGGGHVVLPLLQESVVLPGWVTPAEFLAGYGAAQAVPGPLFTFAAYLGAVAGPWPNGIAGAALALLAIFLPGLLILVAALPFWDALRRLPAALRAIAGTNAAVVGILAAALYDPVATSAVHGTLDLGLAAAGLVALVAWRVPVLAVVVALAALGGVRGLIGV